MSYVPELGQAVFSNSPWGEHETPGYVTEGILLLASFVACGDHAKDPTANMGPQADFDNGTFAMRAYCWCDGEATGHENGCPPNFKYRAFEARWYKHASRGESCNFVPSYGAWRKAMIACLESLA
jgi:hypothetical protein